MWRKMHGYSLFIMYWKFNKILEQGLVIHDWNYEKIYPYDSFIYEISKVNKKDAIKYLENAGEKVKVFEIANNLGLSSRVIAIIAELVGVKIHSMNAIISKGDLNRIIGYIINNAV